MAELSMIIFNFACYLTLLATLISFIRFLSGPSIPDRVVALDSMTTTSISLIVLIAFVTSRVIYLDVALVYGLLSFLSVVAVARYLEGGL